MTNPNVPETPRLIIPLSESCYFARDTREIVPEYQLNYTKQKVGGSDLLIKVNSSKFNGSNFVL